MKYLVVMDEHTFAERLLNLKTGETIEFATCAAWSNDDNCYTDGECWYFATKIYIPGYESRFILIDYSGGEEAFAIPMNCYSDEADEEDIPIVEEYVHRFWKECNGDIDEYVYLEVEDDGVC